MLRVVYRGIHYFNRCCANIGERVPCQGWETAAVPAIVPSQDFEAVRLNRASRNPWKVPGKRHLRLFRAPTARDDLMICAAQDPAQSEDPSLCVAPTSWPGL